MQDENTVTPDRTAQSARARAWFEGLRDRICAAFEGGNIDAILTSLPLEAAWT